jgi:hypothetical protein
MDATSLPVDPDFDQLAEEQSQPTTSNNDRKIGDPTRVQFIGVHLVPKVRQACMLARSGV